ncbi:MAG: hypothetical protein HY770_03750, partial [Chitinivibrionia bacterium]|nr:hypothetical protein [Chitinivibrionia bacterium]
DERILTPCDALSTTRLFTAANVDSCCLTQANFSELEKVIGRMATHGECMSLYAHDIALTSSSPCVAPSFLAKILKRARQEGLAFYGYDERVDPETGNHKEPGWVDPKIANWTLSGYSPGNADAYKEIARLGIRSYLRELWSKWGGQELRIALYGAGAHTQWLEAITADLTGPRNVLLLDDRGAAAPATFRGLIPIRPEELPLHSVDLVVVSSDTHNRHMAAKLASLYGAQIPIIDPYSEWPQGPYPK